MSYLRPWYPTRRLRAGYTMLELALVTSLMGIVAVMSMGRISAYVQERNVSAAAATVRNDLQQAFAIAARNRQPVRISFAAADTAVRLTDRADAVTYLSRRLGNGSGFMLEPSDIGFCTSTCTGASIDVYPNGWASDTLLVTINKGPYSRTIRMARSGLVVAR